MTIWFLFQVNRGNGSPPWVSQIKVKVEPSCTGSLTLSSALPCSERTNGGEEGTAIKHVHQQNVQGKSELINLGISKLEEENSLIQNLQHKRFQKPFCKMGMGKPFSKIDKSWIEDQDFSMFAYRTDCGYDTWEAGNFFFPFTDLQKEEMEWLGYLWKLPLFSQELHYVRNR